MISYLLGPLGGQARAGGMAALSSLRTSVVGGGLLCVFAVGAVATTMPKFRTYDVRTNEFAVAQAKIRKNREEI